MSKSAMKWFELLHPIYRALMSMIVIVAVAAVAFNTMRTDIEATAADAKANTEAIKANAEASTKALKILEAAVQEQATAQAVTNTKIDASGKRNQERYDTIKEALKRIEDAQRPAPPN